MPVIDRPQRHLENSIIFPREIPPMEEILFPVPMRSYAGKPIVIMLPQSSMHSDEFEFQGRKVRIEMPDSFFDKEKEYFVGSPHQPDVAVVASFTPKRDSEGNIYDRRDRTIRVGQVVLVRAYAGAWFTRKDVGFEWIPEGRMVKILGTASDHWSDDLLAELVLEEAA